MNTVEKALAEAVAILPREADGCARELLAVISGHPEASNYLRCEYNDVAYNVITSAGGFWLGTYVQKTKTFLLNMEIGLDIPVYSQNLQRAACCLADHLNLDVLPVSGFAIERPFPGLRSKMFYGREYPTLIHRQGREAVIRYRNQNFLSAYDTQEDPPLYFLCELPRNVKTVDRAREILKPPSVVLAEKNGIEVRRQGDLFCIASDFTEETLRAAGAKIFPDPIVEETILLYGTNHCATRTAILDKIALVQGTMTHDPRLRGGRRRPDHHPLELGDKWWWVARNTVPVSTVLPGVETLVKRPPAENPGTFTVNFVPTIELELPPSFQSGAMMDPGA